MSYVRSPLDRIFAELCHALQLSPTQHTEAEQKYKAVGEWLSACPTLGQFDPQIYPQGSVATGTTVKPHGHLEFDLDLVCELQTRGADPMTLYEAVDHRLRSNGHYTGILIRKNRCLRLDYADEFHLDILPAVPDPSSSNGAIWVPDRQLKEWSGSNPRGFAKWFRQKAEGLYREARRKMEPLPEPEDSDDKAPLKRAVQLLKRRRDIVFDGGEGDAPRSVVLTTLAGHAYAGQIGVAETLAGVLDWIDGLIRSATGIPVVPNPTNEQENFAEKWTLGSYRRFVGFIDDFRRDLRELERLEGFDEVGTALGTLFGEDYSRTAMKRYAENWGETKRQGLTRVAAAGIVTGSKGRPIPRHDFYGG